MVYRFSWIAAIVAIGLAFRELSSVLRDSVTGTPWQMVIFVALLLGAAITWTAISYRAPAWIVAVVNISAFVILAGLVVAPGTLFAFLPTQETWIALQNELARATEIIRHGVEPVRPVPGLVMLISLLFWTLGFLVTAGLLNDRPFVAVITPLIVAVQFSIIDRTPMSLAHIGVFILIVAFALIAIRADERDRGTGRLHRVVADRPPSKRPTPSIGLLITAMVTAGVLAVSVIGDAVPSDGFVAWRSPAGYSDGYSGSSSYNPFVDIRAGLISQTDNPLFTANIEGVDPSAVRFRTVTLDVYQNGRWATDRIHSFPLDEEPWIDEIHRYRGETIPIVADITIQNLAQPWMPAPSTPNAVLGASEDDTKAMRVRRLDGSLFLPGDVTYQGMKYSVRADHATFKASDIGAIARTETGALSPLFQAASDDGRVIPGSTDIEPPPELEDIEFWLETPDDLGTRVRVEAIRLTDNFDTNFEKALALEHYFRISGGFVYEVQVPPEYATGSVEDWLTDEDNPYARHGYCEQFATAMALMARAVGVPSRVVLGFTAGTPLNATTVQVLDKNAHAWVEMWIPQFGWMAFDPTPRSGYAATTADDSLTEILGFSAISYASDIPDPEIVNLDDDIIGPEGRLTPREPVDRDVVVGAGGTEQDQDGSVIPMWAGLLSGLGAALLLLASMVPATKWVRRRRRLRRLAQGDITSAWRDITERLSDLGEPVDGATTPIEAAAAIDEALVPLAQSLGQSLYGEHKSTTLVIDRATDAHTRAVQHIATRYSRYERVRAAFRPTRLLENWAALVGRRNGTS